MIWFELTPTYLNKKRFPSFSIFITSRVALSSASCLTQLVLVCRGTHATPLTHWMQWCWKCKFHNYSGQIFAVFKTESDIMRYLEIHLVVLVLTVSTCPALSSGQISTCPAPWTSPVCLSRSIFLNFHWCSRTVMLHHSGAKQCFNGRQNSLEEIKM